MSTKTNQKARPVSASAGWLNSSSGCSPGGVVTLVRGTGGGLPSSVSGTAANLAGGLSAGSAATARRLAAFPFISSVTPAPAVTTHRTSTEIANTAPFASPFPGSADPSAPVLQPGVQLAGPSASGYVPVAA